MENICFTIVTVCYNEKCNIIKTLESVLHQRYSDFEYIIIDGASTDGTCEVIESYKCDFIKRGIKFVLVSEEDDGIYNAMNKAIKLANGKWINFMNAGDCFVSADVLTEIHKKIDDAYDIVYGDTVVQHGSYYKIRETQEPDALLTHNQMCCCHQSAFVKTDLMKQCLFDEKYKIGADFKFFLYCYLNNKKIKYVKTMVAVFSDDGISSKNMFLCHQEYSMILLDTEQITAEDYDQRIKEYKKKHEKKKNSVIKYWVKRMIPHFLLVKKEQLWYERNGWTRDFCQLMKDYSDKNMLLIY